jgi:hypothetical protein
MVLLLRVYRGGMLVVPCVRPRDQLKPRADKDSHSIRSWPGPRWKSNRDRAPVSLPRQIIIIYIHNSVQGGVSNNDYCGVPLLGEVRPSFL